MTAWVYILASGRNGTLYTGVTSDLVGWIYQHKTDAAPGFTARYAVHTLVWFEAHDEVTLAIDREKHLKTWKRSWKIQLIEAANPTWRDLYEDICR